MSSWTHFHFFRVPSLRLELRQCGLSLSRALRAPHSAPCYHPRPTGPPAPPHPQPFLFAGLPTGLPWLSPRSGLSVGVSSSFPKGLCAAAPSRPSFNLWPWPQTVGPSSDSPLTAFGDSKSPSHTSPHLFSVYPFHVFIPFVSLSSPTGRWATPWVGTFACFAHAPSSAPRREPGTPRGLRYGEWINEFIIKSAY